MFSYKESSYDHFHQTTHQSTPIQAWNRISVSSIGFSVVNKNWSSPHNLRGNGLVHGATEETFRVEAFISHLFFFFTTKFSHRPHDLNLRLSHSLEWLLNFPGGIFHMLGRWCWCRWCSPQRWSSPLKLRKMYIRETILCFLCSLESLHQDSWLRVLTKEIHYECS